MFALTAGLCFTYSILLVCGHVSSAEKSRCNKFNTALLDTKGVWRLPRGRAVCLDLTSLGTRTSIPYNDKLKQATTLYADHMHLTTLNLTIFKMTPQLRLIDLTGNQIRRINKDILAPLQDLHTLLLESNHVAIPKKAPLLKSHSLKALSLSNNKIKRLYPQTFKELKDLTVLYLDRNLLNRLNARIFAPLKRLKYLHLGSNKLKVLPNIVLSVPKSVVILKGNPLNNTLNKNI